MARKKAEEMRGGDDKTGAKKGISCLTACLIGVGVLILIAGIVMFMLFTIGKKAVEYLDKFIQKNPEAFPEGIDSKGLIDLFSTIMTEVSEGRLTPEKAFRIFGKIIVSMFDGVLTESELSDILKEIYSIGEMPL